MLYPEKKMVKNPSLFLYQYKLQSTLKAEQALNALKEILLEYVCFLMFLVKALEICIPFLFRRRLSN